MIFLKLLLNTILLYNILIFMGTIASFPEENSKNDANFTHTYRLPNHTIPYHYNIQILWPDDQPEITNFLGECCVYIEINHPTRRISLHAQKPQINITSAFLKKNANNIEQEIQYIPQNETKYNDKSHILNFYFAEKIPSGYYFFVMKFISFLNDDNKSIFKISSLNSTGNDMWLYATHFQTIGARQIFPCWDEPELKATFNISIRHHKKYIVLWNMNYETETDFNDTMRWMRINIPFKISTYHVAFCLLKAQWFTFTISFQYNLDGAPINSSKNIVWNRYSSQISFAQEVIEQTSKSFINEFENWEKISITQHVFMPGLRHNAIEKLGLVLYREAAVIYDEELDSLAHKIEVACLIARQVAYQWFGITVSPSWWSYHWLNQGIATLLGIDALHKNFADFRTSDLFVVQTQQESLRLDRASTSSFIMKPLIFSKNRKPFEINSLFSFSYYIKAPSILRMLRYVLTDKIFKEGIEKFYKMHMFRSATFDDFCNDMQIVYEERKQSHTKSFIIKDMMTAWTRHKHYPALHVETAKDTPPFLIIEIQNCEGIQLSYEWWIPITITKQTELNFTLSVNQHNIEWMKVSLKNHYRPYFLNFSIKEDEWYIINIQQMGCYRVNYELKNWKNIARYLNSAEYTNIHVLNRAQIIDDAYHFVMEGTLEFSIFLKLMEYLSRETDYIAWYPMFKALEDISRIFPFPDETFNIFKKKILNSLNRLLQNIDYDKKPNEKFDDLIDCLRQEASKWACILGAPNCTKTAETKLHQHLINPETNKLLPWWRHWTFCNGLMIADNSIWYKVWIIHLNNPNSITSKFLACSNNYTIIIDYTDILFNNLNKEMRHNFLIDILPIIVKHASNNGTLNNILKNLKKIPRGYIPK
ncbi:Aminopeptidase N [Camponotus japonicus]